MSRFVQLTLAVIVLTGSANAAQNKNGTGRPLHEAGILSQDVQPIGDPALGNFAESFPIGWNYLETKHFRIASSLKKMKLSVKDRKRMAPELEKLAEFLPDIGSRPPSLTSKEYLILIGIRLESLYAQFQKIVQVEDSDFPSSRAEQAGEGPYMGDGPYLGEREKFEVVLHINRNEHIEFIEMQRGIKMNDTVRWHCRNPSKLIVSMPCVDGDLREDRWLWPHLAHNTTHMLFEGFKFFAYDPPLWLAEGLALYIEKNIEPESWTRDGDEGVFFEPARSKDWSKDILKLVKQKKSVGMPSLMMAQRPADLNRAANVTAWSITSFLLQEHADNYATLIGTIKGQLDEQGYPTDYKINKVQREELKRLWGWTPMSMEKAWIEWLTNTKGK
jgi:hypothetical protein